MDRKIAIPAGIALMVMLAVAGMLALFSFSANPTEADNHVTISGTAEVGQPLMADPDDADSYKWYADDEEIIGENDSTFTPTSAEEGKRISVEAFDSDRESLGVSGKTDMVAMNQGPMLEMAVLSTATTLTLTFNEAVSDRAGVAVVTEFEIEVDDTTDASDTDTSQDDKTISPEEVSMSGMDVVLTIAGQTPALDEDDILKITYRGDDIRDGADAQAAAIMNFMVDNRLGTPEITVFDATVTLPSGDPPTGGTPNGEVVLTWQGEVDSPGGADIDSFELRWAETPESGQPDYGDWMSLATDAEGLTGSGASGDAWSYTVKGLKFGTGYSFEVRGVNAQGRGTTPTAATATTTGTAGEETPTVDPMDIDASLKVPDKPNKNDKVVLKFNAPEDGIPVASWITIVLHEDFDVPGSISNSNVEIDASADERGDGAKGVRVIGRNPSRVDVDDTDIWEAENEDDLIRIRVPDMLVGSSEEQTGDQGIAGRAAVTVTIAKAAGIRAPKEGGKNYEIGFEAQRENINDKPKIGDLGTLMGAVNRGKTAKQAAMVYIPRLVELDDDKAGRGSVIEATAKGFAKETTVNFWRDADGDGTRDPNEARLCAAEVSGDHIGACSFTLTNPPFVPGHGITGSTRNLVNAFDGEGNRADIAGADDDDDIIELEKSVAIAPEDGNPGDKINVQLRDFGKDGPVILVTIAGIRVTDITGDTSVDAGQTNFTIDIPSDVPTGLRVLEVTVDPNDGSKNVKDDTTINIGGANVEASPTMVLPKQEILLSGSGFAGDSYIMKAVLGGDDVYQPKAKNWTGSNLVETDANGNWNTSVEIPLSDATAAAEGTTVTLLIEDATKRVGAVDLTFPERTVTMTPEEGRPGDTITLLGTGYPADDNLDVKVVYKNDETYDEDVNPDAGGRWQHTFKVPNEGVGIPSTNIITVSFDSDDPADNSEEVVETFQHRVPGAGVSVEPAAAAEGQLVTVTVAGFSRFTDVYTVEIGGTNAQTRPEIVNTDRDGKATFQVLVPGLDLGPTTLKASIGTRDQHTTAGTAFEVLDPTGVTAGVPIPVADAFKPLIDDGKLESVYYFNPTSKEWQWYITDPDFADSNTLTEVATGSVATYWVKVTEDTTVELARRMFTLTCVGGNCLTPIIYP